MTGTPNGPAPLHFPIHRGCSRDLYKSHHTVPWPGCLSKPLPVTSLRDTCFASAAFLPYIRRISTFSLYDVFRLVTSRRERRGTFYPPRVEGVLFGVTPGLLNDLSQRSQRLSISPHSYLPPLNGMKKVASVQVALHGMTLVLP